MSMDVPDIYHVALGTSFQDPDVLQAIDFSSLSLPRCFPASLSTVYVLILMDFFFYFLYINAIIHILFFHFFCLN